MKQNNTYNNSFNINNEYPYGELPLKYTKQGQQQLQDKLKNKTFVFNQDPPSNNNSTNNKGFDISALLPLLYGSNNTQMETFTKLLPMFKGGGNIDMQSIIKLLSEFNKKSKPAEILSKSDDEIKIDNLTKVE